MVSVVSVVLKLFRVLEVLLVGSMSVLISRFGWVLSRVVFILLRYNGVMDELLSSSIWWLWMWWVSRVFWLSRFGLIWMV